MKKEIIYNVGLNVGMMLLIMIGYTAYKSGNALIFGLSIALGVVLIYLKIVLLKQVRRKTRTPQQVSLKTTTTTKKKKKRA
ncbi:hypothetical protein HMPREF0765_3459 [Sphingobacterium spiritivorum ATCC 33300]|uniref:Sortase n=1 Tax=Sphingobacterium spiritivorum ATCC 33300 TaxID=525372 RepID=C2G1K3_SPHSI|nr:DUF6358 family protein [Sphingobacterium spiritivorum]EEI90912.1 hypothetical protein HMPREF0765_3459 [Sphingobacterium spiritivorum ATCC 33300]QQS97799.1 sortase [Sphingobacterium spiritivorum]